MRNVVTQEVTCWEEVRFVQGFPQQLILWVTLLATCFPHVAAGEGNHLTPVENPVWSNRLFVMQGT